ncbi:hypothetical protein ADICYQ_3357 [Cyclobacterium qasimii M12-11B]|uniref:Uncharacterized protein n=1 Tax=Cyclobacterium qasimii M12-11B TaxID=641524 RepID=S7WLF7_9BACT|nr:hypothetical protein ADICYQ_3357 [Cyclobacterium qasimii M12-11B]
MFNCYFSKLASENWMISSGIKKVNISRIYFTKWRKGLFSAGIC